LKLCCHWASDNGGTTPVSGLHSVMERPDSVRRVMPPITTMARIIAAQTKSQSAMRRSGCHVRPAREPTEMLIEERF
jgi:hypothetical protein